MTTEDQIRKAVRSWLVKTLGVATGKVIFAHQSGPRPALPYFMVNVTGSNMIRDNEQITEYDPHFSVDEQPDTAGEYPPVTATPVIEREWFVSLHAYSNTDTGAEQSLRPLQSAIRLTQQMEPMFPSLIVHAMSRIRSVPEFVNNVWEPRANCDIFVRGLTRDGFVIDVINDTSIRIESNRGNAP